MAKKKSNFDFVGATMGYMKRGATGGEVQSPHSYSQSKKEKPSSRQSTSDGYMVGKKVYNHIVSSKDSNGKVVTRKTTSQPLTKSEHDNGLKNAKSLGFKIHK